MFTYLKKRGVMKDPAVVSFCVHGWRLEDHRVRKKIQIARNIAWGGAFKKVETKY